MKIVLAPNAFKGSLTTSEAATAMAEGVLRVAPEAEIVKVPVADGGDGLVDVAAEALEGESRVVKVTWFTASRTCSFIARGPSTTLRTPASFSPARRFNTHGGCHITG